MNEIDKTQNIREKAWKILVWAGPILYLIVILRFFHFRFMTNDDTTMISIFNGSYTGLPDGHVIFIHYPLSLLIAFLYRCTRAVSWYQVIFLGIYVCCISFSLIRIRRRFGDHALLPVLCYCVVVGACWSRSICRFTFSTCAAFVSATSVLWYALIPQGKDLEKKNLVPVLALFWLSFCIRRQYAYSGLMLLGVLWLYRHAREMFRSPRCWLIPAAALAGILCIKLCDMAAYSGEEWKEYQKYDDIRSEVFDYSLFVPYMNDKEFYEYVGMNPTEMSAMLAYRYGISSNSSMEAIKRIYEYAKAHPVDEGIPVRETITSIGETLRKVNDNETSPAEFTWLISAAIHLAVFLFTFRRQKPREKVYVLLLFLVNAALWAAIHYRGRINERALLSLYLYATASCWIGTGMLLRPYEERLRLRNALPAAAFAGCLLLLCLLAQHELLDNNLLRERTPYNMYAALHPENIYIRDTFQYGPDAAEDTAVNCVGTGGWDYYSPIYWKKMEFIGLPEGVSMNALLRDNVYLITGPDNDLHDLLGLSHKHEIEYEIVDDAMDIRVYKIKKL